MTYYVSAEAQAIAHVATYYETIGDVYLEVSGGLAYPVAHIADWAFETALVAGMASWTPYEDALLDCILNRQAREG